MILQRDSMTDERTYGTLKDDDGQTVCFTIEQPWRNNQHGDGSSASCIPEGNYLAFRFQSPHLGYELFQLANVPDRIAIEIHKGNVPADSRGCILTGTTRGQLGGVAAVLESAQAFATLMQHLAGVDRFTLSVRDPLP